MVLQLIVATTIFNTIIKSAYSTIIILFLVYILVLLPLTHHRLLDAFLFATDVTVHRLPIDNRHLPVRPSI